MMIPSAKTFFRNNNFRPLRRFMGSLSGPDRLDQLTRQVGDGDIDTVVVGMTDLYGRTVGKRYDAADFLANCVQGGAHACNYLFTVDMDMNPIEGYKFSNWSSGFGDFHLVPDLNTLTTAAWMPRTAYVLCDVHDNNTEELIDIAPRSMLRNQISRLASVNSEIGSAKLASELEYFLFKDGYEACKEKSYVDMKRYGWYSEDYLLLQSTRSEPFHHPVRQALKNSGIPVENCKGETGVGQHEINVRYEEALNMADRHILLKQCMKEVAMNQDVSLTFMAKPFHDDAGSSCHIHLSLHDESGQNLFPGEEDLDAVKGCSPVFKQFLAGWIKYAPEVFAMYAPTVNSYKRFQSGSWAPTACAWGVDNRTAGFRVVGAGKSLRIECRLPGADCNPYLAFSAAMASGLAGIEEKLDPPPMFEGDAYSVNGELPLSLGEAAERFGKSEFVAKAFGTQVQEHYHHFFKSEQESFDRHVTDWERSRYFEQI